MEGNGDGKQKKVKKRTTKVGGNRKKAGKKANEK